MKNQNIDRYRFDYQYGKAHFDVFFFIDESPFVLLFGAKGGKFSFERLVKNGFLLDIHLDHTTYKDLIKFLDIQGKTPFSTLKFFQDFDSKIPTIAKKENTAKPEEIIKYRSVEEAEKIYFWKWLNNEKQGNRVSEKNLEKTKKLLGLQTYMRCKEKNISSCWTDDISKKSDV
jgi:hypothetical protein